MATAAMARETYREEAAERDSDRNTLMMLSGVALMVFGAGLILTSPVTQKYLGKLGLGNLTQGMLPDLERYLRLRAM